MEENDKNSKVAAAATLSPEFLGGGTAAGLEKMRARLLDLTNRNRLLNFRHTKGAIRVVDVDLSTVFTRLLDGDVIPFRPVPDPPRLRLDGADDAVEPEEPVIPGPADYAASLGWGVSHDLTTPSRFNPDSRVLPVLHYLEDLESLSRKVNAAARTAIEESGTNMLYLVFGFLEWYESDDSRQAHMAPLVTIPVSINRNDPKGKGFECRIEYSGEDIETNWSLVEKARRDFGLEIPPIEEDDDPGRYFARLEPILAQKSRWRIRHQLSLTLLSFGKLLMYRDLDARVWPGAKTHPLVTELFEGRKSSVIAIHANEHPIDDPRLAHELPPLVVDADSSQHSALIDAMRGQNLVIEGPPGTGKSQTITNLIAAALFAGKTVLFVSEKLAALEVVRRRLDEIGLGLFCLELHSHKTKKNALLGELETRLKAGGSFHHPRDLQNLLVLHEEKKRSLSRYAELVNKTVDPIQATVFDILWAREHNYQALSFDGAIVDKLFLPSVVTFSRADLARAEQFLTVHAEHLTTVLRSVPSLDAHPWAWVSGPLTFRGQEKLCELLEESVREIGEALKLSRELRDTTGMEVEPRLSALPAIHELLEALPGPSGHVLVHVLAACRASEMRARINAFIEAVERAGEAHRTLAQMTSTGDPATLLRPETREGLGRAIKALATLGFDDATVPQLQDHLGKAAGRAQLLADSSRAFMQLTRSVGCELPFDLRGVQLLLRTLSPIESAPLRLLHLRSPQLESEGARHIVKQAAEAGTMLLDAQQKLNFTFDLDRVGSDVDGATIRSHMATLEDSGLLQRLFGSRYRAARRTYRRLARSDRRLPRHECARHLRTLVAHIEASERFAADGTYKSVMGSTFAGLNTKWADILEIVSWYDSLFTALPDDDANSAACRELMLRSRSERLASLNQGLADYRGARTTLESMTAATTDLIAALPSPEFAQAPLNQWEQHFRSGAALLADAVASLKAPNLRSDVPVSAVPPVLTIAEQFETDLDFAQSQTDVRELHGPASFAAANLGEAKATVRLADSIASGAIPKTASDWLLSDDYPERLEQLRRWLSRVASIGTSLSSLRDQIRELASSGSWHEALNLSFASLQARADLALARREELSQWLHLQRSRTEASEKGLSKLTALAEDGRITPLELLLAFRFVFYNTLSRAAFAEHPDLFQFSGLTQDQVREQFAKADREVIRLTRERVAATVASRPIPSGRQSGPVREWTELGLITQEIKKQKRHIPIRQLVSRSAAALQAMKPCFMMGPLSVAQYLPPHRLQFDLIVMDEASQLKPEDAIGAISRGGQVVIVGDPKQLPPTNFFQRLAIDDDELESDDELTALEESESILDVASTLYQPVRRLRWHYRSKHHSLIAFSNQEFYQGDLVIFPSAYHESSTLGVKYHAVPSGVFEQRRNQREAAVVVDAVLDHMQRHPDESLGVVALNFEQRELIEELLDARLRSDPFAATYQERMEGGTEPLFVKNLENVQGDERDVIFISGTYGPDVRGNQYQRFGPINGPHGHRRLNVLFTRARKRTEVFSSLDPDKIQTSSASAFGLRALKQYLTFARTGVLLSSNSNVSGGEPANDFERSVGNILNEKGFEVVPQVGVAGFFVDLAVRHPTKVGAYLLGVECDGATYHSGRSARDRDRLRQEILENQGWRIHRIWSTDWFKSRNAEVSRLLNRIDSLLENDTEHQLAVRRAKQVASLRDRLIELKDKDLALAFPDSPPESCLLRDSMLDTFVLKRPRTRDDWFRAVPHEQRAKTDARQVGRYLEKVLAIIADCSE